MVISPPLSVRFGIRVRGPAARLLGGCYLPRLQWRCLWRDDRESALAQVQLHVRTRVSGELPDLDGRPAVVPPVARERPASKLGFDYPNLRGGDRSRTLSGLIPRTRTLSDAPVAGVRRRRRSGRAEWPDSSTVGLRIVGVRRGGSPKPLRRVCGSPLAPVWGVARGRTFAAAAAATPRRHPVLGRGSCGGGSWPGGHPPGGGAAVKCTVRFPPAVGVALARVATSAYGGGSAGSCDKLDTRQRTLTSVRAGELLTVTVRSAGFDWWLTVCQVAPSFDGGASWPAPTVVILVRPR